MNGSFIKLLYPVSFSSGLLSLSVCQCACKYYFTDASHYIANAWRNFIATGELDPVRKTCIGNSWLLWNMFNQMSSVFELTSSTEAIITSHRQENTIVGFFYFFPLHHIRECNNSQYTSTFSYWKTYAFKLWQTSGPTTSGKSIGSSVSTVAAAAATEAAALAAAAGLASVLGSLYIHCSTKVERNDHTKGLSLSYFYTIPISEKLAFHAPLLLDIPPI